MGCFNVAAVLVVLYVIIKVFKKLYIAWDNSPTCLVGKTVIVTGSNTGIGFYTAQDFAKRGARVILACRNTEKATKAKDQIIESTGNPNIIIKSVDFGSLKSVREFANDINDTEKRLDILVNNAGAMFLEDKLTEDGLTLTMQTNYFAPFLLTLLLIDLLKKSAPSRIVNVASSASIIARLDPDNLNVSQKKYLGSKFVDYANSKICDIIFTRELGRRLNGTGVTANCLHPGIIATELFRNYFLLEYISRIFTSVFRTPEEGAQTTIYLAVSKEVQKISMEYFHNCRIPLLFKPSNIVKDPEIGRKIWMKSEHFVKLTAAERKL